MIKDFTNHNQALKLKALGFDEPCVAFFQKEYHEITPVMVDDNDQYRLTGLRTCKNSEIPEHYTAAPTFAQAFTFFRDKGYDTKIQKESEGLYFAFYWTGVTWIIVGNGSYREAELACLDKLIEMVEKNTNI